MFSCYTPSYITRTYTHTYVLAASNDCVNPPHYSHPITLSHHSSNQARVRRTKGFYLFMECIARFDSIRAFRGLSLPTHTPTFEVRLYNGRVWLSFFSFSSVFYFFLFSFSFLPFPPLHPIFVFSFSYPFSYSLISRHA